MKKLLLKNLLALIALACLFALWGCDTSGGPGSGSSARRTGTTYANDTLESTLNFSYEQAGLAIPKAMKSLNCKQISGRADTYHSDFVYSTAENEIVTIKLSRRERRCQISIYTSGGNKALCQKISDEVDKWL